MASMQQVNDFAHKWLSLYRADNTTEAMVTEGFADDCFALDFEMDTGKGFIAAFSEEAFLRADALQTVINDVTNAYLLGSAIFSKWRGITHWWNEDLLAEDNRKWFITALSHLADITSDTLIPKVLVPCFRGTVQKIRIESDNVCFGPCPEPEDEVEQHLTINNKGRIWFSGYNFGHGKHEKVRSQSIAVDAQQTQRVLDKVGRYFMSYNPCIVMDVGSWNMTITNTDGEEFKFFGALCSDFEVDGEDLSDSIRDLTGMQDLFVFDANEKPDKIERMTVDYHKVHTIRHKPRFEDDPGQLLWNYTERLVIDRAAETIQFTRNIGTGCSVTHSCYIQEGVPDLLDRFDADELLEGAPGIPEDLVENPDLKIEFAITLDMKKGPQQTCSGYYDCFDLPKRWAAVMDEIWEFVSFYGFVGDMFDPDTYKQRRRRANELIFVYVTFDEYGKEYCYLADEDIYHPGSKVTVPVGIEGKQSTAKVTRIEYLSKEKAPFPLDKIKRIKPIQE